MICVAFPILWNTERKNVRIDALLSKGEEKCEEINIEEPQEDKDFKLVFGSGISKTSDSLEDTEMGLSLDDCLKIKRTVEMY